MADEGQYLTDKEIEEFLDDLDNNNNGEIEYAEVEFKLDEVHDEIAPKAQPHNLHYKGNNDEQRHKFLRSLMKSDKERISRQDFKEIVKTWKVPSMHPDKKTEEDHKEYMKKMNIGRRIRSYWSVQGPQVVFLALVVSMQIAFGVWQCVKYVTVIEYRQVSFTSIFTF